MQKEKRLSDNVSLIKGFLTTRKTTFGVLLLTGFCAAGLEVVFILALRYLAYNLPRSSDPFWLSLRWVLGGMAFLVLVRTLLHLAQARVHIKWVQSWIAEQRRLLMDGFGRTSHPFSRKSHRDTLHRVLDGDFRNIKSALFAWHQSLFSVLQLFLFVPLLFLFSRFYFIGVILLAVPVVALSRWRVKVLHRESSLDQEARHRIQRGIQYFLRRLEYYAGNGILEERGRQLSAEWEDQEVFENKWEYKQAVFPQVMELIYFLLLTGLMGLTIGLRGVSENGHWEIIPFAVLLLLMYKPVREWARSYPKLIGGEKAWRHFQEYRQHLTKKKSVPVRTGPGNFEINGVDFEYAPGAGVFSQLFLTIPLRGTTLITGPNGVGKSTLLKLMLRLEQPQRGEIIYPVSLVSPLGLDLGYLQQKALLEHQLLLNLMTRQKSGDSEWLAVNQILDLDPLLAQAREKSLETSIFTHDAAADAAFSGGEMQRLCLAGAFLSSASYLLLDEPTTWLPGNRRLDWMQDLLRNWSLRKSGGVLLISHEPALGEICDSVIELGNRISSLSSHEQRC